MHGSILHHHIKGDWNMNKQEKREKLYAMMYKIKQLDDTFKFNIVDSDRDVLVSEMPAIVIADLWYKANFKNRNSFHYSFLNMLPHLLTSIVNGAENRITYPTIKKLEAICATGR